MEEITTKNESLADIAAKELINLIKKRDLRPGDKLPNEYELAELLRVGRSSVREATRRLVSRNILVVKQGSGTFVSQKMGVPEDPLGLTFIGHDPKLALDLSDTRMLVEPAAAASAAKFATEDQIAQMEALCEDINVLASSNESYTEKDHELHRLIAECCGNSILKSIIGIMTDASSVSIRITKNRHRAAAYAEHSNIVKAIKRRDPAGARYAMIAHLNTARNDISEQIENYSYSKNTE